jgi:hypothetical protein
MSDIEIARKANLKPISEIGERLDVPKNHLIQYGSNKAKISNDFMKTIKNKKKWQINPRDCNYANTSWRGKDNNLCRPQ